MCKQQETKSLTQYESEQRKAIKVNNELKINVDMKDLKYLNLSRLSAQSSGKIRLAKCSEIEIKETITLMKHVNKLVMNAAPKIRLRMTKNTKLMRRQTLS